MAKKENTCLKVVLLMLVLCCMSLGYGQQAGSREAHTQTAPAKDQKKVKPAAGRCKAKTNKGTQCIRSAAAGSKYCWQHNFQRKRGVWK